jgi:hypothetical protein
MILLIEICPYLFKFLHEFFGIVVIAPKLGLDLVPQWRVTWNISFPFRIYAYNGYVFMAYTN